MVRFLSAAPGLRALRPTGAERAAQPSDRVCADGTILTRNTLRRDNAFFTWDLRLSRRFALGNGVVIEPIVEVFNLTNADNYLDTAHGSLLFNFDGTLRSGLGDTRRGQVGGERAVLNPEGRLLSLGSAAPRSEAAMTPAGECHDE